MTLGIIWAVSYILDYQTNWWRLILAAVLGTIYSFIVLILANYDLPFIFNICLHPLLNLLIAYSMVIIAFWSVKQAKIH